MERIACAIKRRGLDQRGNDHGSLTGPNKLPRVRSVASRAIAVAPGPWGKFAKGRGHARPCVEG
jgi:hypothetical protein